MRKKRRKTTGSADDAIREEERITESVLSEEAELPEEEGLYSDAGIAGSPEEEAHSGRELYGDSLEAGAWEYLDSEEPEPYHTRSLRERAIREAEGTNGENGPLVVHPAERRRSDTIYGLSMPGRPRKKKKHKKKHYLVKFLAAVLLIAVTVVFLHSPFFDIEKIRVEGRVNFTKKEIVKMSGVKKGQNLIFDVKRNDVRDRLLEDPYIETAIIKRELPKTVVITITEREELATIRVKKGHFAVIDKDGYVLRTAKKQPKITRIAGIKVVSAEVGKKIEVEEQKTLDETMELLTAMKAGNLYFKRVKVSDFLIRVNIYDKLICKGTPADVMENIENGNLEKILYDLTEKKITKGTIVVGHDQYCSFSPEID